MAKTLHLVKMQAAGNDFLVVDDMQKKITSPARLAARLCHRQYGVGADGLILLQPARGARRGLAAYRMRIINSDGSEAEMCGNGSRCAVKFAVERRIAPASHILETMAGRIAGRYLSSCRIQVALTAPADFRPRVVVPVKSGRIVGSFINTGVPHFVTFVNRVERVDVKSLGNEIRFHRIFSPKGTNVNFVQILPGRRLRVRTYERGVESETLACGTGATASAVVAALVRHCRPPVIVRTSGGATLVIRFEIAEDRVSNVTMEGPVEKVFETEVVL